MRRAWLPVAFLVLALAAAGCGDDDEGGAAPSTTTTTLPPTTSGPPGPVPLGVDPCDLLTPAEVAAATGLAAAPPVPEPPVGCRFDLEDAGVAIVVIVEDGAGRLGGAAAIYEGYRDEMAAADAEQIPGLGEDAVYAPGFRGLAIDLGEGRYVAVAVGGGYGALAEPRQALVTLAGNLLARL